jgi:tRNA (mo5U34)-methyltransferase
VITQAEIDRLDWFHSFEFPGGLKATSREQENAEFHRRLWAFISDRLAALDFRGKSVLDIGCWDGYFSFLAARAGASKVLSVDDFSQNWGAKQCYLMAQSLYQAQTTLLPDVSVYDLSSAVRETFDVILFLGVYYHLHAPYAALAQVRGMCHNQSIVVIEGDCFRNDTDPDARIVLNKQSWPKFVPTTRLLRDLLHSCYFKIDQMYSLTELNPPPVANEETPARVRKRFGKLLSRRGRSNRPPPPPAERFLGPMDRVLIVARPTEFENEAHCYPPPFGLERFDTRWGRGYSTPQADP